MVKADWRCQDCGKSYPNPRNGFCNNCGGLIIKKEAPLIDEESTSPPVARMDGECGLGILVLDFSESMVEPAFVDPDLPQRKIDLVANAFHSAMQNITNITFAEKAYVAVIGFDNYVELLDIFNAAQVDPEKDWKQWIYDHFERFKGTTNISGALDKAKDLYDAALACDLSEYGIDDFAPLLHDITVGDNVISVPNVRVFLYSDGDHNHGDFYNPFDGVSLIGGKSNVNGLITAYFGPAELPGYKTLLDLAGTCPRHEVRGTIHITVPQAYPLVRQLFRMASAASGFCAQCAKEAIS